MHNHPTPSIVIVPIMAIVAVVLMTVASTAQSDETIPGMKGAPNVAEMLQRRQETQLREQLVKEGRWDEVRKMDEEQIRRQRERQQQVVTQMNEELSRGVEMDAPATASLVDACDKESLRMRQMKSAHADKNMTGNSAY
jgi:hypothetical protein